jgi:mannose PTS system EIIA component
MLRRGGKDAIVGVVVVTHEGAADALLLAAKAIVGPLPATVGVPVPVGEPQPTIVERLSRACAQVDEGAGVLLLVDLHGSTPFHAAMAMLDGTRPAEVLCGVNLAMLMKLSTADRADGPPVALAELLRECGRRSIRLGSELTGKVPVEERRSSRG